MQMLKAVFAQLPDPRDVNAHHDLTELLLTALAASLAGAQTCTAMAEHGCAKESLLRQLLTLKHGIPSHDTPRSSRGAGSSAASSACSTHRSSLPASPAS